MRALILVALAVGVVNAEPACFQIDLDLQVRVGMNHNPNQDLIQRMLAFQGSNINNGLSNLVSSAALCQQSCKVTAGCSYW